jgi:hypothetical protein
MLLKRKAEYNPKVREHLHIDSQDPSSLDGVPSPRVLNTHLLFRWLPQEHFLTGRKIVNVVRNPKDAAVSLYCHLQSIGEGFGSMPWSEFFDKVVVGKCKLYYNYNGHKE